MTADQSADWVNANSDYIYIGANLNNGRPQNRPLHDGRLL